MRLGGFRVFALVAVAMGAAAGPARADWAPLQLLLDNGVRISTNELPPTRDSLNKKYPLRWMVDGDPRTAWVFEGPHTTVPEIRVTIPESARPDRLRIINGYAKSRTLYRANNRITAFALGRTTHQLAETLRPQETALEPTPSGPLVIRLSRLARGTKHDHTCISEMDVLSHGTSLLRARAHVWIGGGEYPIYALYRGDKLLAKFPPETVMEAFFIVQGAYAVFVHPPEMHSPGVTIYNVTTGRKKYLLPDLALVSRTLKWTGHGFVGRARDPRTDKAVRFSRSVRLP